MAADPTMIDVADDGRDSAPVTRDVMAAERALRAARAGVAGWLDDRPGATPWAARRAAAGRALTAVRPPPRKRHLAPSTPPNTGRVTPASRCNVTWLAHPRTPRSAKRYRGVMAQSGTTTVTVPVVVERDEDGVWCAHAQLRPGVGAHGEGNTEEEALDDLREALTGLIKEFGVPRELSVTFAA